MIYFRDFASQFLNIYNYPFSVRENPTNTETVVQLVTEVDGVRVNVDEKIAQCDFSFSIRKDHLINQTTIVGHIGKDAIMTFIDPGMNYFFVDFSSQSYVLSTLSDN